MTQQTTTFIKSSRKRRIAAFVIDHFVITFLMALIVFLILGNDFINENNRGKMITIMLSVMIPCLVLYFVKDSFKGISIGKWIMGIMVRDESDQNKIPSFGRLFLRNLLFVIWPVEFVVCSQTIKRKGLVIKLPKLL